MKKTILSLIMVSMIMALPLAGFATSNEDAKKDYKQTASEALAKGWTKIKNLNLNGVIENKKTGSDQRVHVKDSLKVDLVAIFRGNAIVNGVLKNTLTDTPLKIDDALRVTGLADFEDFVKTAALRLNPTDVSSLDTSLLVGGEIYYDSTEKITYLWNGSSWIDLAAQGTTYTAGNGIAIDSSDEVTTDETYSHTWTSDQTFSEQIAINGASVNDSYGINNSVDENGERGENITVSAETDGITNYGSYYTVDPGTAITTSANRVPTGIQFDVTTGPGIDAGWNWWTWPMGTQTSLDATADALEQSYIIGHRVITSGATGNNQDLKAFSSALDVGGTGTNAWGMQSSLSFETGSAQTGVAYYASNLNTDAGDTYKGLEVVDWNNTAGTAYGLHIDLDDAYDTAYSIWVEPGSAPSSLGDIYKASPTSAPPETCNATWNGSFYVDSDLDLPCFCNGTNWLQMDDFVSVCS